MAADAQAGLLRASQSCHTFAAKWGRGQFQAQLVGAGEEFAGDADPVQADALGFPAVQSAKWDCR